MSESDKTMFEIYREASYNRHYRCILYTDLEEHARDGEIAKAASGQTVLSGFLRDDVKDEGRAKLEAIVDELNDLDEDDDPPAPDTLRDRLGDYLAE